MKKLVLVLAVSLFATVQAQASSCRSEFRVDMKACADKMEAELAEIEDVEGACSENCEDKAHAEKLACLVKCDAAAKEVFEHESACKLAAAEKARACSKQ
jgi:hypothetical protein